MRPPFFASRSIVAAILLCATPALADYVTFAAWGSKWDDPVHGTPATVTWGFVPDGTTMAASFPLKPEVTGTSNVSQLRNQIDATYGAGAFNAALQRAFATWHAVSGVTFVGPVADAGSPIGTGTSPDIRVGAFNPVANSGFSFVAAVGYGPPGDDLHFPDAVAGDVIFNLAQPYVIAPGAEGAALPPVGNDLEGLFLHELGHAAIGLGHPVQWSSEVMYVGAGCCTLINRKPSVDDIAGAVSVYGLASIPACSNGQDDDGDGLEDAADPGCASPTDIDEHAPTLVCDNGADDDGDGRADFDARTFADSPTFNIGRGDKGCHDASWTKENPQCQNGLNDDAQTGTDFDAGVSVLGAGNADPNGSDPQCVNAPWKDREAAGCGIGAEIALLLFPLWNAQRRRRRQRSSPRAVASSRASMPAWSSSRSHVVRSASAKRSPAVQ